MATGERVERVDYGDPLAPPGTAAWAKRWALSAALKIPLIEVEPLNVESHIELGAKYSVWTLLLDASGLPFDSFDAFCEAPRPHGCEFPAAKVRRVLAAIHGSSVAFGVTAGKAPRSGGKRQGAGRPPRTHPVSGSTEDVVSNQGAYARADSSHGNGANALAARIARDAPEVHEAMKAGKYPSVRAAAKAAGIVKDPDPVTVAKRAVIAVPVHRLAELACALPVEVRRTFLRCLKDSLP